MSEKSMFRAQVPPETARLVRLVAELKKITLSQILTEALDEWLKRPDVAETVEKHNLLDSE